MIDWITHSTQTYIKKSLKYDESNMGTNERMNERQFHLFIYTDDDQARWRQAQRKQKAKK